MNRELWLQERKKGIGGSDAASVLGLNKYSSPLKVYLDKVSEGVGEEHNNHTMGGILLEPVIIKWLEQQLGEEILTDEKTCQNLISPEYDFIRCNLDGKIKGKNEIVEVKTTEPRNAHEWDDDAPIPYLIQCQHNMYVDGADRCHLAVFITKSDIRKFIVDRDDEFIKDMVEKEKYFWENHVLKRVAPDLTKYDTNLVDFLYKSGNPDKSVRLTEEIQNIVIERQKVRAQLNTITAYLSTLDMRIKDFMRDAEVCFSDEFRITWKEQTRKAYAVKESTSRIFKIKEIIQKKEVA